LDAENVDKKTVSSFGDEWQKFDQANLSSEERQTIFQDYFSIFPWHRLPLESEGFDMGCGTGRWAKLAAEKTAKLHCIDPSEAIEVAKNNLSDIHNVYFHKASVDSVSLAPESQDFGYSLGVLHHIPDTQSALNACIALLKPGAPFLLYLYYALDNRPFWFRCVWRVSNLFRHLINKMSPGFKSFTTDIIATLVYFPLARLSAFMEQAGFSVSSIPLCYYRSKSFYTMRTDARDRFGTPLEQRFSKCEIAQMMQTAGLTEITFSEKAPFWCAVGYKRK